MSDLLNAKILYKKRSIYDEIYTPIEAILPLVDYIPKNIKKIWEPASCLNSNIKFVLETYGYDVVSTTFSDLDFFIDNPCFEFDMIITNPPYSKKDDFIKKCIEYKKPFALLMPLTTLEGKKRHLMFKNINIQLLIFDKRINFIDQKKQNWFNTSWFLNDFYLDRDLNFIKL